MATYGQEPEIYADTPRYGERTLAGDMPDMQSAPPSGYRINWGKVVKGAAVVTAVVLAGFVVTSLVLPYAAGGVAALNTGAMGGAMAGIVNGASWLWGFGSTLAIGAATAVGAAASGLFTAGVNALGLGGMSLSVAQAHTAALTTASVAGGAVVVTGATAAHAHGAMNGMIDHGSIANDSAYMSTTAANAHSATMSAKIGHEASEHHGHGGVSSWMHKLTAQSAFASTLNNGGSYTDALRAAHGSLSAVAPRNGSFSQQLNADRAALEATLKDPTRA